MTVREYKAAPAVWVVADSEEEAEQEVIGRLVRTFGEDSFVLDERLKLWCGECSEGFGTEEEWDEHREEEHGDDEGEMNG